MQGQFNSTTDMVLNYQAMEQMNNLAQLMAQGKTTVPKHLQTSPADCMAVIMQAAQWKMNPFAVAQKTHLVNGTLGYEAQLVNAVIKSSGAIQGRFHFQYGGEWPSGRDAWVQCGAVLAGEAEIQWGEQLFVSQVSTKNSPLWKTAPKQQAAYLATKYWARLYCPEVILGVYSDDELTPATPVERDITPKPSSKLAQVLGAAEAPALEDKAGDLLSALSAAESIQALKEVAKEVHNGFLSHEIADDMKPTFTDAYNARFKELSVDVETGEVVEAE